VKWLAIVGLGLTFVGAFALAWRDLTAKRPTWTSISETEWQARRRFAWLGFPAIALGTALQVPALATS
jgi:hypothetical protein